MVTVTDIAPDLPCLEDRYGPHLLITLEGDFNGIRKGSVLTDCKDKTFKILEVARVKYINPKDFLKKLEVIVDNCDIEVGDEFIVV